MQIITIDGPAGSGKSTIAKILAEKLGYLYIDSGSLYRAFAYWILKKISTTVEIPVGTILGLSLQQGVNIENFTVDYSWKNNKANLVLDGEVITDKIRSEQISKQASVFAADKSVRAIITKKQRQIAELNNVVLEGRDAGTVVFPNADRKFFLTASLDERAKRRSKELESRGEIVNLEDVKKAIENRDFQDENRKIAPLVKAKDALEIDTTGKNIDEVVDILRELI